MVAGRYEMAIMQADNLLEADILTMLAMTIVLAISLPLGIVSVVLSQPIANLIGLPELEAWIFWVVIPVFATGIIQVLLIRLNWQKSYANIASARVIQSGSYAVTSLALGVTKMGGSGMLIGYVAGLGFAILYLLKKIRVNFQVFNQKEILVRAKKYLHYPMYSAPSALLDVASMYMCIFILGRFYSSDILGQFSLTHRLLLAPIALVGIAVSQVFYQRAVQCHRDGGDLQSLLWTTSKKLLMYSLPAFALFAALAPVLFEFMFGAAWHEAGDYARWVVLAYWARLGVSPISSIFMAVNRIKVGTLWQITYFCSSITVLGLAAWVGLPIIQFLMLYAIHETILYALYFWFALKACNSNKNVAN